MAASIFNGMIVRYHHDIFTEGNVPLTKDIIGDYIRRFAEWYQTDNRKWCFVF